MSSAMLFDALCEHLLPLAAARRVVDVRVGLGYTGVLLDDGRCGLAYTFRDAAAGRGCGVLDEAGALAGRPASDVALLTRAPDPILAAVGLAALNALAERPPDGDADVLELVSIEAGDEVGMVGHFRPLVAPLRRRAKAVHVFERQANAETGVLSAELAADILPRCRVAIITATSLLNRTLDGLLALCRQAREVVVLGPSTPLQPRLFADRGATVLSGVWVDDAPRALRIISEGGGTRRLQPAVRKVNLRVRAAGSVAQPS